MFNNVVMDVFIGLVLVFLLYSLLVTILGEMFCNWIGLRSRILRVSIEKMLNDGYYRKISKARYTGLWYRVQRFFLKEFPDFRYSFAGKFYNYPAIKYLSSKAGEDTTFFSKTKPSYLSAEIFADSLVQLIKDKSTGATDMEQVQYCLQFNTHNIQPATLRNLRNMAESSGNDINVFKNKIKVWYNETQDRATGWHKEKLQVILFSLGFLIAVIFNVDTIQIARILAKDKDARDKLVQMGIQLSKDSARYKEFVTVNGDSVHAEAILDSGFARIQKDIREANLVLGLGWGTDKLLKPLTIKCNRDNDGDKFLKIENRISQYDSLKTEVSRLKNNIQKAGEVLAGQNMLVKERTDSLFFADTPADTTRLKNFIDSTQKAIRRVQAQISRDSFLLKKAGNNLNSILRTTDTVTEHSFAVISSIRYRIENGKTDSSRIEISGFRNYYWYEKTGFVIQKSLTSFSFIGFFITGIMISLGAPFWFDLLKKLVSIRSEGVKPEEKKPDQKLVTEIDNKGEGKIPPAQEPSATDPAQTALENLTRKLKNETGIIAIAVEYRHETRLPFLVVMTESTTVQEFLKNKYGNVETVDKGVGVPIEYSIDQEITVHAAMSGSEISNENKALGAGTLGCHIQKNDSNELYFISCWHVMKDDANWDGPVRHNKIISENKELGVVETGFLAHNLAAGIDIGIAKYINQQDAVHNPDFLITGQHRSLTSFDSLVSTPVRVFGKVSKRKEARIFHDKINARIKYPDGTTYLMNDVFSMIAVNPETNRPESPTTAGDSGAVVTDANGVPLGMIIGGSGKFSYAMKFSNVFGPGKPYKEYFFKT